MPDSSLVALGGAAGGALLLIRLALVGVFALSGTAKLLDPAGSRQALKDFGAPTWSLGALAVALPVAELFVAVALLADPTAVIAAAAGASLLLAFTVGIVASLLRGRYHACHCFGQLSRSPISWGTVARNAILTGFALLVALAGPGHSLATTAALPWVFGAAAALALSVVGGSLWALWHQQARLMARIDELEAVLASGPAAAPASARQRPVGLPTGADAPAFEATDLGGNARTLADLLALGRSVLLVFTDPRCGPCTEMLPAVSGWQRGHADRLTVAVVGRGERDAMQTEATHHQLTHVLLQRDAEIAEAYRSKGTPSAVLIHADGTIAGPPALGAKAIAELVGSATVRAPRPAPARAGHRDRPKLAVGEPAPRIHAHDTNGRPVGLANLAGRPALLVFWNPQCGFCRGIAGELTALINARHATAPEIVLVTPGTAEANGALGVPAATWLDPDSHALGAFGARGTPSALLLDADGRIATEIAVGATAVLDLVRAHLPEREEAA